MDNGAAFPLWWGNGSKNHFLSSIRSLNLLKFSHWNSRVPPPYRAGLKINIVRYSSYFVIKGFVICIDKNILKWNKRGRESPRSQGLSSSRQTFSGKKRDPGNEVGICLCKRSSPQVFSPLIYPRRYTNKSEDKTVMFEYSNGNTVLSCDAFLKICFLSFFLLIFLAVVRNLRFLQINPVTRLSLPVSLWRHYLMASLTSGLSGLRVVLQRICQKMKVTSAPFSKSSLKHSKSFRLLLSN